jgi:hypothetical protein
MHTSLVPFGQVLRKLCLWLCLCLWPTTVPRRCPSWLIVSMGGSRFQRPGPSPTLGSLGPLNHRRHKSRVSLQGPFCAHDVSDIPFGEVSDTHFHQTESMPSSTILVVDTPILKLPSFMVQHCVYLTARPPQCIFKFCIFSKVFILNGPLVSRTSPWGVPATPWAQRDPGVTPGTCDAIGERDQVILMWVRAPGI